MMRKVEGWLDQGMGSCLLHGTRDSGAVIDAMHEGDGQSHELGAHVVMPNHVHAIVRPLSDDIPLEEILRRWKGKSAVTINREHGRSGVLWQRESFDRIIRDEEHLWRVLQYIGRNPSRANLANSATRLWVSPLWIETVWDFEPDIRARR